MPVLCCRPVGTWFRFTSRRQPHGRGHTATAGPISPRTAPNRAFNSHAGRGVSIISSPTLVRTGRRTPHNGDFALLVQSVAACPAENSRKTDSPIPPGPLLPGPRALGRAWYTTIKPHQLEQKSVFRFLPPSPSCAFFEHTPAYLSGDTRGSEEGEGGVYETLRQRELGLLLAQLPDRHVPLGEARRAGGLGRGP